ncbi:hypothetical protein [Porphyromonas gingivicanis]|uniref:hypothetical protein n=1 Tax=Porphyromonas gingivicanis TaxID=266762 RepID=UPI00351E2E23
MAKQKKMMTCDGNQAAAHIAYMFSEVAAIYPSPHLQLWLSSLMNGQLRNAKTYLERLSK